MKLLRVRFPLQLSYIQSMFSIHFSLQRLQVISVSSLCSDEYKHRLLSASALEFIVTLKPWEPKKVHFPKQFLSALHLSGLTWLYFTPLLFSHICKYISTFLLGIWNSSCPRSSWNVKLGRIICSHRVWSAREIRRWKTLNSVTSKTAWDEASLQWKVKLFSVAEIPLLCELLEQHISSDTLSGMWHRATVRSKFGMKVLLKAGFNHLKKPFFPFFFFNKLSHSWNAP